MNIDNGLAQMPKQRRIVSPALQLIIEAKDGLSPCVSGASEMIEVSKRRRWKNCGKISSSWPLPMERKVCSALWEQAERELLGLVFPQSSCVMHVAEGSC